MSSLSKVIQGKNEFMIIAGIIANNAKNFYLHFSLAVRVPTTLINEAASDRLALAIFHDSQSLFNGHFNTSSIVSVTFNGRHYTNLTEPVIIWFMRNKTTTLSELMGQLRLQKYHFKK
jgi:hypothetical protein